MVIELKVKFAGKYPGKVWFNNNLTNHPNHFWLQNTSVYLNDGARTVMITQAQAAKLLKKFDSRYVLVPKPLPKP